MLKLKKKFKLHYTWCMLNKPTHKIFFSKFISSVEILIHFLFLNSNTNSNLYFFSWYLEILNNLFSVVTIISSSSSSSSSISDSENDDKRRSKKWT